MKQNIIGAIAIVGLVAGVWALASIPKGLVSNGSENFGTTAAGNLLAENYIPYVLYNGGYNTAKDINTTGGFTVGSTGATFSNIVGTSCNLVGMDASQSASTTVAYDCAVTGVTSSSIVLAQLASSTPVGAKSYWSIIGSKASTTAGFVTVLVYNNGASAIPSVSSVGSSTAIWTWR